MSKNQNYQKLFTLFFVLVFVFTGMMNSAALAQDGDGDGGYTAPGNIVFGKTNVTQALPRATASDNGLPTIDGATYITSSDNVGDGGTGPADGDMYTGPSGATSGITTYGDEEVIEFNINVTGALPTENAVLTIYGWDVDEEAGEVNNVYFNGHFCGRMTGANDVWNTTVFEIDKNWVQAGNNLVEYYISTQGGGWVSAVDWGQLLIDGGARARADIPEIVYLSQENSGGNSIVHTRIPVEIVQGTPSDYFRLEVNFLDPNGNVVTSQTINNISGNTDDIINQFVDISYPTNSPSGTYWINANVFLVDGNIQQVYKKMEWVHTQNVGPTNDPEIKISGAGIEIPDGSTATSTSNYTNFGTVQVGNNFTRNFAIENMGSADLNLSGGSPYVSFSGTNAGDFVVTGNPSTPISSGGGKTYFSITFTPGGVGTRSATVSVSSDDPDESPYTFNIQGTATPPPVPEIDVTGNGNAIADGSTNTFATNFTDFGNALVAGGNVERTFYVNNSGGAALTVSDVSISGANAVDFTIVDNATGTIGAGGNNDLSIRFDPSVAGARNATVTITSDDADEGTYTFNISGTGQEPEIGVTGNGNAIADGASSTSSTNNTDFGTTYIGLSPTDKSYVIQNSGNAPLTISSVNVTGAAAGDFSITSNPSGTINAGNNATLTIRFTPSASGARSATVTINNNDATENPFTFAIVGDGQYPREINITGNGQNISTGDNSPSAGDNTLFGSVDVDDDSTESQTFVIENTGSANLTVSSVQITGANASDFTVSADPSGTIGGTSSANLEITFNPSVAGERNATVTVNSDDADESSYTFAIRGTGYTTGMDFTMTTNYQDAASAPGVQLALGAAVRWTYIVTNTGSVALSNVVVTDDTLGVVGTISSLAAGATDSLVQNSTAISGEYKGSASAATTYNSKDVSGSDVSYYTGQPSSISGLVWHDKDRDGIREAGEPGMQNVVAYVYDNSHTLITDDTTDADGNFTLEELEPGDYTLEFAGFGSYFVYSPMDQGGDDTADSDVNPATSSTAVITLGNNENLTNTSAGVYLPAVKIAGLVWKDQDNDGRREWEYTPVSGIKVELYDSTDTKVGNTKSTNALGEYEFNTLDWGKYYVRVFGLPQGYGFTKPDIGPDNIEDSDVNPITGKTATFVLMPGDSSMNVDAGILQMNGFVSGDLFIDEDGNGVRDQDEGPLADVAVVLMDVDGNVIANSVSDNDGTYRFQDVNPGGYKVAVVDADILANYSSTTGGDTASVTLNEGENLDNVHFGYKKYTGMVSGNLFMDDNGSGSLDAEEAPLADVKVWLLSEQGVVLDSAVTDQSGSYSFNNIVPGPYQVAIENDSLTTKYASTTGGHTVDVTLGAGENLNVAFGFKEITCSISATLFTDNNRDGVKDDDEAVLANVEIVLSDIAGIAMATLETDEQGTVQFADLAPGNYLISVNNGDSDLPNAFWPTVLTNPFVVELTFEEADVNTMIGMNTIGANGGNGVIGDYVWHDSNWNRQQDGDEEHLPYVVLYLYQLVFPNSAQGDGANHSVYQEVFVDSVRTNYFGTYYFTDVEPGDYIVRAHEIQFSQNQAWMITSRDSMFIHMAGANVELNADFGFAKEAEAQPGEIRLFVYDDLDYNRQLTDGEPGLANVTVDLYKKGELVQSEMSDGSGNVTFTDVMPGDYKVAINDELVPLNYVLTSVESTEELFLPGDGEYDCQEIGFAVEASWGTTPNRIIAKFETWYNNTDNGRYWDVANKGGIADTSLIGLYNSNDQDVADYHILQAWANGIDGFAVDWFGWYTLENQGLNLMLDRAQAMNEKYGDKGFHFEVAADINENAVGALDSNLTYIAESLLVHDAYWGTERQVKRPVFVDNTLQEILHPSVLKTNADSLLPADIMLAWNGAWEDSVSYIDVCYPSLVTDHYPWANGSQFDPTFLDSVYTRLSQLEAARQTGFIIGGVFPGFDDRNWVNGQDRHVDAADTSVYAQTWRKVLEYDDLYSIPWVMVQSWNNFNDGTAIQPGLSTQYSYNQLTRDYARQYKAPEINPDSVGVADLGLLVPRHIYVARMAARMHPDRASAINQQIEQAYERFFARDYSTAIEVANQAAGLASVEITDVNVEGNSITLQWQTVQDANTYYIHVSKDSSAYAACTALPADMIMAGNVNSYTLADLEANTAYYVTVTAGDTLLGSFVSGWYTADNIVQVETSEISTGIADENGALPKTFALDQNFPNPFNPVTTIQYALPKNQHVTVTLYNTLGQQVMTLIDTQQAAGFYNVQLDGSQLGSGIYFYRIVTQEFTATRKLLLVK